ncbi:MAG TPA: YqeG family HAD IIIA-type phosphatase [Fimbriimonadaceae bacterium]|nr:YqeG family HAD IIIA-type phosphatase [Fimbriimonadaceae bacterium]
MSFRTGKFERTELKKSLQKFCPIQSVATLSEVDLAALHATGKKLILIDVDNTMLPWREEDIPPSTIEWLATGKNLGLDFCIVSNTRNVERLTRLSKAMGIGFVRDKFKPSRQMFLKACEQRGISLDQAVMIGDQVLTDILGANRTGIDAILVQPMSKREFVGTKVNRIAEKWILKRLNDVLANEDDDLPIVQKTGIFQRRIVRQFAKFAIVGGSSFVIDTALRFFLLLYLPWGSDKAGSVLGRWMVQTFPSVFGYAEKVPTEASVFVMAAISASVAILNSFIWNRRWTFNIRGKAERAKQLRRFVVVSVIGMLLNTLITTLFNKIVPGHPARSLAIATVIATIVVAIWNFSGQRLYAFRRPEKPTEG